MDIELLKVWQEEGIAWAGPLQEGKPDWDSRTERAEQ